MKQNSLIEGKITSALIKFTIPILLALLLQTTYGMVDLLIVGNFSQVRDVSGVSTGSQLITLLTAICNGLAMGTTILIGRVVGRNKMEEIPNIIRSTTHVFIVFGIVVMGTIFFFIDPIIALLNTPTDAIVQTKNYIMISTIGIPLIFSYNILGSIFRGLGDSKTPLIAVAIACVVNITLDLIFVAGFSMGAAGAAIATVVSQGISVILCMIMINGKDVIQISKRNNTIISRYYSKEIIRLGLPVALQSGLVSISFLAITVIVNQFGLVYSASIGLVEKLTGIIMLVPMAFMNSLTVFVAQNNANNQLPRSKEGLKKAFIISSVFSSLMAFVAYFHGDILIRLFSSDIAVIEAATIYLKAYAFDTLLVPIIFCLSGYFSGSGQTLYVMVQGIFGSLALRIPLTYYFSLKQPVSLFQIGLAIPISTLIQIGFFLLYS